MSYFIVRNQNLVWIEHKIFSKYKEDLLHFSTSRLGGLSAHPQASLNLGFTNSDDSKNVLYNRNKLAYSLGISFNQMVFSRQTHSSNIHIISENDNGKGAFNKESAINNNDGYVLTNANICACILTADCTPVFFYDPIKKIAAIVHSGWRGTVKKISANAVKKMIELGCNSNNILVGIGPSIKECCYEVKEDVIMAFRQSFGEDYKAFFSKTKHSTKLNMDKAIMYQLIENGILQKNIENIDLCTHCNPFLFFSARNSINGMTGRMVSGIMLRKEI